MYYDVANKSSDVNTPGILKIEILRLSAAFERLKLRTLNLNYGEGIIGLYMNLVISLKPRDS